MSAFGVPGSGRDQLGPCAVLESERAYLAQPKQATLVQHHGNVAKVVAKCVRQVTTARQT